MNKRKLKKSGQVRGAEVTMMAGMQEESKEKLPEESKEKQQER